MSSGDESALYGALFGADDTDAPLTARAALQAMLDVEAALAAAEAELDVVPAACVPAIAGAARAELYDIAAIAADAAHDGNVVIPLVRRLRQQVGAADPEAAGYVHWGATSQDILDTALVLQLQAAVPPIVASLERATTAAAAHARRHLGSVMAGRTWLQQAVPITFGLKAAGWTDALARESRGVADALEGTRVLQLGGAAGTLAALGDRGPAVADRLGARLGLVVPSVSWHAHRDRLARLACALGVACGTLGKIGRDLALLAQSEVGEAREGRTQGGGSSTMPHKHNPVHASVAVAASVRAPGLVATMLAAMPQEHERGVGGWQAEWVTLPDLVRVAAGAARAIAEALERLVVDEARMRLNLEASRGLLLAEAAAMALAPHVGRGEAHDLVRRAADRVAAEGLTLVDALAQDAAVTAHLSRAALERVLSPEQYLGATTALVERTLARVSER